jgi:recombination protein RecA
MFGNPETTTGGRALKFYASVRMEIRRTENIKNGDEVKGMRARVKVVKNKMAPPFRDAEVDIIFGHGISKTASVLDAATAAGIISRSGTWYTYGDLRLGQGRDNAREFLDNNPEVMREIDRKVREARGLVRGAATPVDSPAQVVEPSRPIPPAARSASEPVRPAPEPVRQVARARS